MWLRTFLTGSLAVLATCLVGLGALARFVPDSGALSTPFRLIDSLAPQILGCGFLLAVLCAVLGARRIGGGIALLAVAAAAHFVADHRALSLPVQPDLTPELRIVFFNALHENAAAADRIATALRAADPDVAIIAEADATYPALPRLSEHYQVLTPCAFEMCDFLVLARPEVARWWQLTLNPVWEGRYVVTELAGRFHAPRFIVGNHLVKPWFDGISGSEIGKLGAQYDWLPGDVVVVGDFNAAPWTYSMRRLLERTGFRALRRPLSTWPANAGWLGVPIDQVLVHGGARVQKIARFGADLGSNHAGLVVDIAYVRQ